MDTPSSALGDDSGPKSAQPALKKYYLVLFQSGLRNDNFGALEPIVFNRVQTLLDGVIRTAPEETEIDV
jgi:hypothetical protein